MIVSLVKQLFELTEVSLYRINMQSLKRIGHFIHTQPHARTHTTHTNNTHTHTQPVNRSLKPCLYSETITLQWNHHFVAGNKTHCMLVSWSQCLHICISQQDFRSLNSTLRGGKYPRLLSPPQFRDHNSPHFPHTYTWKIWPLTYFPGPATIFQTCPTFSLFPPARPRRKNSSHATQSAGFS